MSMSELAYLDSATPQWSVRNQSQESEAFSAGYLMQPESKYRLQHRDRFRNRAAAEPDDRRCCNLSQLLRRLR